MSAVEPQAPASGAPAVPSSSSSRSSPSSSAFPSSPSSPSSPSFPSFPVFDDPRGRLVPVEFDAVPFVPQRVFVVVAPEHGAVRGDHGVPCRELLVLVTGTARVVLTSPPGSGAPEVVEHHLDRAGQVCLLEPGAAVVYHLSSGSTVVVLADEPYAR